MAKSKRTEKKLEQCSDISLKILSGSLLTEREWEIAKAVGMYTCPLDTPYSAFYRTYYEDEDHRGYLCLKDGKIQSGTISKEDGKETFCLWGIHREDVKPEKLREDQKELW